MKFMRLFILRRRFHAGENLLRIYFITYCSMKSTVA